MRTSKDRSDFKGIIRAALMAAGLLAWSHVASAQFTNVSSVLNGVGNGTNIISTGGSFTNIGSAAQPGGIAVSSAGTLVNYAGFLNTFILATNMDTDADGIVDENDFDDDNDGLGDYVEARGGGFNPQTQSDWLDEDSDDDGLSDKAESIAGTDPTDASIGLQIVTIDELGPGKQITWQARSGVVYRIKSVVNPSLVPPATAIFPTNVVGVVTGGPSGVGVWAVTTNTFNDLTAETNYLVYGIEALQ